uniref:Uncharacterized protein n=1 Tax=Rhizophora mucronata TaxID=61149 RepID=A0A2P2NUF1_RHIMU
MITGQNNPFLILPGVLFAVLIPEDLF